MTRVESETDRLTRWTGFTIGTPRPWRIIDARDAADRRVLARFAEANPLHAPVFDATSRAGSAVKFFSYDPHPRVDLPTTLLVAVEDVPDGTPPDVYVDTNIGALQTQADVQGRIERRSVHLPAGDAVLLRYPGKSAGPRGEGVIAVVEHVLVHAGNAYVISFATVSELEEDYDDEIRAAARSFRFLASD